VTILKLGLFGLALLLGLAAALHLWSAARFRAMAERLVQDVVAGPAVSEADLPPGIRAFAEANRRGPAPAARALRLVQEFEFRQGPEADWGPMEAVQHVGLGTSAFVWVARAPGRLAPGVTVIDAYVAGAGFLHANLFGSVPVARGAGPVYDRAEAMRYLAELPWAPDAILGNPEIAWTEIAPDEVEAALATGAGRVSVRFTLDAAGDIVAMSAMRPDLAPDGTETFREWRGRFGGYEWVGDRRIPTLGEVGYAEDGATWLYFRGRVTALELLP
jgi:hypothetical protein